MLIPSWNPGVVEYICSGGFFPFKGLEGCYTSVPGEQKSVQESGLVDVIHNPVRGRIYLSDPDMQVNFPDITDVLRSSRHTHVSFHLSNGMGDPETDERFQPEGLLTTIIANLEFLARKLPGKRLLFEQGEDYKFNSISPKVMENYLYLTGPSIITDILKDAKEKGINAGLLLDLSHMARVQSMLGHGWHGIMGYAERLCMSAEVYEIHANCPGTRWGGLWDRHLLFDVPHLPTREYCGDPETSRNMLELLKLAVTLCPNANVITMECDPAVSARDYVLMMACQKKYIEDNILW